MLGQRIKESVAMMMIGDGLLAMCEPRRHCLLWKAGPKVWQEMVEPFVEHPGMTRLAGAAELAIGFWLATRQQPDGAAETAGCCSMNKVRDSVRSAAAAARRAVGA